MKFKIAFAALAILCPTIASAAEPQEVRKALMKETGAAFGALNAIARGQKPFDAATVKTSIDKLAEVTAAFPQQFPKGTETGFQSEASIKVWEDPAGFKAATDKFAADVQKVSASMPTDQASVGAAIGTIGANCGACHQTFRVKR